MGTDGNIALRQLTDEEFRFLSKFNDEFVEGNFDRDVDGNILDTNLHYQLVNSTEDSLMELKSQIKEVSAKLADRDSKYCEKSDRKSYWRYKKNLYKEMEELKEKLKETDVIGNVYKDKYARRNDLMTYVGKEERTVLITDLFQGNISPNNEEALFEYVESVKL